MFLQIRFLTIGTQKCPHDMWETYTDIYPRESTEVGLKHLLCLYLCVQTDIYASTNSLVNTYQEFLWSLACRGQGCSGRFRCWLPKPPEVESRLLTIPILTEKTSLLGGKGLSGPAVPSQRRTCPCTPCLGRMATGAGFHTRALQPEGPRFSWQAFPAVLWGLRGYFGWNKYLYAAKQAWNSIII